MNEIKLTGLPPLPEGDWSHAEIKWPKKDEWFLEEDRGELRWAMSLSGSFSGTRVVLVPAKKYRTPSLPDDWGKECEFRHSEDDEWDSVALIGFIKQRMGRLGDWLTEDGPYKHARIEVKE